MDSMQKASTFPSHLKIFFFKTKKENEIINPYYYYPVLSKWLILHNLVFVLNNYKGQDSIDITIFKFKSRRYAQPYT